MALNNIAPKWLEVYTTLVTQGRLRYYETYPAPNKGIAHKPETKRKMSEGMKRYWSSRR